MREIIPGLYTFTGLLAGRVYAIADSDGLTLVDASIRSAGSKILNQVRRAGFSEKDVKRILITHAHPDHVGGLKLIIEKTGAHVIASESEARVIQGEIAVARPNRNNPAYIEWVINRLEATLEPVAVDRIVKNGEVLEEVMEGLQVIDTPGHAPGHISFWQARRRILFIGDVIFNLIGMTLPFPSATPDMAENIRSVQKIATLEPEMICFGHGPIMKAGAAERLKTFAHKVSNR